MRTTRTGGRQPGRRGNPPAKQSPRVWLAKAEGPDGVSVFRQQVGLNIWKVINEQICSESGRSEGQLEGGLLSPGKQSSGLQGTKAIARAISLAHPPAKIPKGTSSCQGTCLHSAQTPNTVLLRIHPSGGSDSLPVPVLQGPS